MEDYDYEEDELPRVDFDVRTLRARKAWCDETTETLAIRTRSAPSTVTAVMRGRSTIRLLTLQKIAAELGLQVQIRFTPLETLSPISTTAHSVQPEATPSESGMSGRKGKPDRTCNGMRFAVHVPLRETPGRRRGGTSPSSTESRDRDVTEPDRQAPIASRR